MTVSYIIVSSLKSGKSKISIVTQILRIIDKIFETNYNGT